MTHEPTEIHEPTELPEGAIEEVVASALREDIGTGDLTAVVIPENTFALAQGQGQGTLRPLRCGVVCRGLSSTRCGRGHQLELRQRRPRGSRNRCLYAGGAPARALLTGERTALNFLQLLSATATAARRYADAVEGTGATILDTRKTIPGLRDAQKFAVRCGGAENHRHGLYDAILIKENHIAAAGSLVAAAVGACRRRAPAALLEVEVENLDQLREALACGVDRLLLDNFAPEAMREAVSVRDAHAGPRVTLEASGGVALDTVRATALAGVDYISVGALTKHVRAVDFSMRIL